MAEQQGWLASGGCSAGRSGEIDLQAVAEVFAAVELNVSTERFELGRKEGGDVVDGCLVVAGRFDLDELANCADYFVLTLRKIAQALSPPGLWGRY
jgi:hypothetical protein